MISTRASSSYNLQLMIPLSTVSADTTRYFQLKCILSDRHGYGYSSTTAVKIDYNAERLKKKRVEI